jgi:hypothetical protein
VTATASLALAGTLRQVMVHVAVITALDHPFTVPAAAALVLVLVEDW